MAVHQRRGWLFTKKNDSQHDVQHEVEHDPLIAGMRSCDTKLESHVPADPAAQLFH